MRPRYLSDQALEALEYIRAHPGCGTNELAGALGWNKGRAHYVANESLVSNDLIRVERAGGARYFLRYWPEPAA